MTTTPRPIKVTAEINWPRLFDEAIEGPVLLEWKGINLRLDREDEDSIDGDETYADYVRRLHDQTIGIWAHRDVDKMIEDLYEARRAGSRPVDRPVWHWRNDEER